MFYPMTLFCIIYMDAVAVKLVAKVQRIDDENSMEWVRTQRRRLVPSNWSWQFRMRFSVLPSLPTATTYCLERKSLQKQFHFLSLTVAIIPMKNIYLGARITPKTPPPSSVRITSVKWCSSRRRNPIRFHYMRDYFKLRVFLLPLLISDLFSIRLHTTFPIMDMY